MRFHDFALVFPLLWLKIMGLHAVPPPCFTYDLHPCALILLAADGHVPLNIGEMGDEQVQTYISIAHYSFTLCISVPWCVAYAYTYIFICTYICMRLDSSRTICERMSKICTDFPRYWGSSKFEIESLRYLEFVVLVQECSCLIHFLHLL